MSGARARRSFRHPVVLSGLAILLSGCATFSEDGGFSAVTSFTSGAIDQQLVRIMTPEAAIAAEAHVAALVAQPLTADAAVRIALLNNRDLQASYAELGLAEVALVEASLPPAPTISVGRVAAGGALSEIERQFIVNILSLATLPQRKAIAEGRFRQAQLAAALATLGTAAEARRAFYRAAAAHQTVHLLERAQLSAEAASDLISELGKTGAAPKIDQAREHAFYAEVTAQLAQARLAHDRATEALARALGLWGRQFDRLREPGALPPLPARPLAPRDIETEAVRRRLDLQIARIELIVLARSLGLEQSTRYVDLVELIGISATERETVIEHGERETEETDLTGLELELQVPIFDFGETRVRRARETYLQAVHRLAGLGVDARSEAREAYKAVRATYDIARLYRDEVVPLRRIVSEESTLRYSSMIDDVSDLLADARAAIQSNVAANEALLAYWLATVDFQMALAAGGGSAAAGEASLASAPAAPGGAAH